MSIKEFFNDCMNRNKLYSVNIKGLTYKITYDHYQAMKKNKLTQKKVYVRLENGWRLQDAFEAPEYLDKNDLREWLHLKEWQKELRRQYKTKKIVKPKPWRKKYPQHVKPSLWFRYLSDNDIFPKVKI